MGANLNARGGMGADEEVLLQCIGNTTSWSSNTEQRRDHAGSGRSLGRWTAFFSPSIVVLVDRACLVFFPSLCSLVMKRTRLYDPVFVFSSSSRVSGDGITHTHTTTSRTER